ncbi:hypothetical protein HJG60_010351 [Phyllostomus discolor]|uniref:Uncharacterized protein n=1 Tax=Phyllostomus discolor TaxID=89673 RepID=A0A834B2M8_9CHIR|nr:hypothetical protein HJG60_010351 [Phyllostomus discolor]
MLRHASTLATPEVAHGSVRVRVTLGSVRAPPGPRISFPREPRARRSGPSPCPRRSRASVASKHFAKWNIVVFFFKKNRKHFFSWPLYLVLLLFRTRTLPGRSAPVERWTCALQHHQPRRLPAGRQSPGTFWT